MGSFISPANQPVALLMYVRHIFFLPFNHTSTKTRCPSCQNRSNYINKTFHEFSVAPYEKKIT